MTITVNLPESVLASLGETQESAAANLVLTAIIHAYAAGEISQGKAAELAGMSRDAFMYELSRRKVSIILLSAADIEDEMKHV